MTLAQITALATQTNARMLRASDTGDWYLIDSGQTGANAALIDSTTANVLQKLQGAAADPDHIGAEHLPETITPTTLVLPDFGATTPPVNALGLSGGRIAKGDGVTVAGVPLTPRRVAGLSKINLNGTNKASARFAIVEIPLTAAEMVAGALIDISGSFKALLRLTDFYSQEDPVLSMTFGFAHDAYKTDVKTKWVRFECLPAGAGEVVELLTNHVACKLQLLANPGEGVNQIYLTKGQSIVQSDRWTGDGLTAAEFLLTTPVPTNSATSGVSVTESVAGSIWLSLEIVLGSTGTNGAIEFNTLHDLDITVTLP